MITTIEDFIRCINGQKLVQEQKIPKETKYVEFVVDPVTQDYGFIFYNKGKEAIQMLAYRMEDY